MEPRSGSSLPCQFKLKRYVFTRTPPADIRCTGPNTIATADGLHVPVMSFADDLAFELGQYAESIEDESMFLRLCSYRDGLLQAIANGDEASIIASIDSIELLDLPLVIRRMKD